MSIYFHGTSVENANKIFKKGFKTGNSSGKFGYGSYFSNKYEVAEEHALCLADEIVVICVSVEDKYTKKFTFKELTCLFPALNYEEDIPEMKAYVLNLGYHSASVKFEDKTIELVVYDNTIIKFNENF